MTWLTAVRIVLDPSPRQARLLALNAGGARFAFNFLLTQVINNYQENRDARDNGEAGPGHMNVTAYGIVVCGMVILVNAVRYSM